MIKSDSEIYALLEHILKDAGDGPQTAPDIWDYHMDVREHVADCNKLSDRLGHM